MIKNEKLDNSKVEFLIYFIEKNKRGVKYIREKEVSGQFSFK